MLQNRKYKNYLPLKNGPDPVERRKNLTKEVLRNNTFFPEPLTYEDFDQAMMDWSNETLDITFEGNRIPTIALYTNQRFEEYMQEWSHSDEKNNVLMNFKTITRENNPKHGSLRGQNSYNIPGDRFYTIHREQIVDRNNQISYIDYKMKQPFAVDLTYTINLVTCKFELLNIFNTRCQDLFKSGYAYLKVKGHYVTMKMEDPTDDSEYSMDDRRYFSQTIKITVKAYIIQKQDFRVEEIPQIKYFVTEGDQSAVMEYESDEESVVEDGDLYFKPLVLNVTFLVCDHREIKTRIPYKMVVKNIKTENVRSLRIFIDGEEIVIKEGKLGPGESRFEFQEGLLTKILIIKANPTLESKVIFEGYDKDVCFVDEEEQENSEEILNIE